ncbi:SCO2322 family protein [Streptomyces sp. AK02-01A]|uniref:SCO2322 family protein n=1 Tax=Streptomyces sp. AK02-01A TaxID=3028648 RepID=UPI0029B7BDBD|nr:SCO2322 family protein [Streptomyces sp. AK02-01A]MDX3849621.1 SCO2322 family protein [Streptomyces sp. AK02-01A]MDX3849809.1 SCO2322 family protein [Streptomyces sp. AK02-01A]
MIRHRLSVPLPPLVCLVLVSACLALVLGAGTARAAGYRYWSFWESDGGKWTYATQGPATARPADGDVNGFRFSLSADNGAAAQPRRAPGFDAVCGDTPAKDGGKRIAVVVDPGTSADAADGRTPPALRAKCALVGEDATAAEALAAVAKPLRYNSDALLCAIAGYPESGCGEQVSDGKASSAPARKPSEAARPGEGASTAGSAGAQDGGGPSVGLLAGGAAVVLLGAAGFWQARRRRR